jgi:chaperonin GroEL
MSKDLMYGDEARQKVLDGVSKLAKTVAVTMGPKGRNVIVGKSIGAPTITKDGVSVAREVVLDDPIEELGCQLVKEVAGRTADVAGDGTTTAIVLAHEIFSRGKKLTDSGYSSLDFRIGIDWALGQILKNLNEMAKPVDNLEKITNIATISTNNDQVLGSIIAEAYHLAGIGGMVTAEARPGVVSSVRQIDGIEIKSGFMHTAFLDDGKASAELDNCYILILNREMSTHADNIPLFTELAQKKRSLLVICPDLNKEAKKFFVLNHTQGRMRVCAVKTPTFGPEQQQWLEDLSMMTGATIADEEAGNPLSEFTIDDLGFAKRIEVSRYLTRIIGPKRNEALIKSKLEIYSRDKNILLGEKSRRDLEDRMAFLSSKATVITVGYSTELELREKGDRVEDAMSAVRAAIEEGFVTGGGFALLWAAKKVEDDMAHKYDISELDGKYHAAAKVLLEACSKPAKQIIINAGEEPEEILNKCSPKEFYVDGELLSEVGYNTATGKFGNLVNMGVIDPKKVTKTVLNNATSIALLLITTEAVIADNPFRESGWVPPSGWRQPKLGGLNHKY